MRVGVASARRHWQPVAALVAAPPAAWALPRLLGLPADDPLAGTVAMVPLVVAGLFAVEVAARLRGARQAARGAHATAGVALLGWLLLAAARARLDLPLAPALAAALFALLGAHLLGLLPRLRPLL
ncbi:MAG TPA: hypothetical protein VGV61_00225, partial [Thermoanaerobaculia bacterium]|nr:hypothetical protein [Thermoanaerobaculia bacterium]